MVAPQTSFLLEVLSHSNDPAQVDIRVIDTASGSTLVSHSSMSQRRENPLRSLIAFETATATNIDIELDRSGAGVAFHSVRLRPNLLRNGGFEGTITDPSFGWDHSSDDPNSVVKADEMSPYAGAQSACLESVDSPDLLEQSPSGMEDHAFYIFGSQMFWPGDAYSRPGVNITNGTLFGTGAPYSDQRKAYATASQVSLWHTVATAGRRYESDDLNARNDLIKFGAHSSGNNPKPTSVCIDSAFTIRSGTVLGTAGPVPWDEE